MSENLLKHIRQHKTLLELEEAGDIAAVMALIKIWQYEHLNLHNNGDFPKRLRRDIAALEEQLIERREGELAVIINHYITSNPDYWRATLKHIDNLNDFATSMVIQRVLPETAKFRHVKEILIRRFNAAHADKESED